MTYPLGLKFDLAGSWADHVWALALTEHWGHELSIACLTEKGDFHSADDPTSFQALGLLQQHPAYIKQFYGLMANLFPASVHHSHSEMQIVGAASFFQLYVPTLTLDGTIQANNLGVGAYRSGQRNEVYLERWSESFQKVRSLHV